MHLQWVISKTIFFLKAIEEKNSIRILNQWYAVQRILICTKTLRIRNIAIIIHFMLQSFAFLTCGWLESSIRLKRTDSVVSRRTPWLLNKKTVSKGIVSKE
jgi:hypothetical protein